MSSVKKPVVTVNRLSGNSSLVPSLSVHQHTVHLINKQKDQTEDKLIKISKCTWGGGKEGNVFFVQRACVVCSNNHLAVRCPKNELLQK